MVCTITGKALTLMARRAALALSRWPVERHLLPVLEAAEKDL